MKIGVLVITISILTACKTAETLNRVEIVQSEEPLTIGDDKTFSGEATPSDYFALFNVKEQITTELYFF